MQLSCNNRLLAMPLQPVLHAPHAKDSMSLPDLHEGFVQSAGGAAVDEQLDSGAAKQAASPSTCLPHGHGSS